MMCSRILGGYGIDPLILTTGLPVSPIAPENYFVANLETGKLNVFTSHAYYDALPAQDRDIFRRYCLWSKNQRCWVSKGKAERAGYLRSQLEGLGFADKGQINEKLPFEEQIKRERSHAAEIIAQSQKRAEKAEKQSDALLDKARQMGAIIPFGQPILVGHHSEKRDRNYRDKIHNTYGKAFEEQDKAAYYKNKAASAMATAQGKKYQDPAYLNRRIKECEKNIRVCGHRLDGKYYAHSAPEPVTDKAKEFYTGRLNEEMEKLDFYKKCLKDIGGVHQDLKITNKRSKGKGL